MIWGLRSPEPTALRWSSLGTLRHADRHFALLIIRSSSNDELQICHSCLRVPAAKPTFSTAHLLSDGSHTTAMFTAPQAHVELLRGRRALQGPNSRPEDRKGKGGGAVGAHPEQAPRRSPGDSCQRPLRRAGFGVASAGGGRR